MSARLPTSAEQEVFRRMRLDDESRLVPWLRAQLERTPWWRRAPQWQTRVFTAYELGEGFSDRREAAFLVEVARSPRDSSGASSALFLVRTNRYSRRALPELRTIEEIWSSEHQYPRNLGMMRGDDGIAVLYWEDMLPSADDSGPSTETIRDTGVQPVARSEVIGYGWLAWIRDGRLVIRRRTCPVIPPV